jgi:8-oxo-dGTP pyrophosphatase MutT (NUDIX family)
MAEPDTNWTKISSKTVHQNPYFRVQRDEVTKPDGTPSEFFVVTKNPSVFVVAVTKNHEIILVKLFRYMTGRVSVELPAGGTDGEEPLVAAKRELQEETGYTAGEWRHLGKMQGANGVSDQVIDIYLATELKQTDVHEQEEEGITELLAVPLPKVKDMVGSGEISDLQALGALFVALPHLGG